MLLFAKLVAIAGGLLLSGFFGVVVLNLANGNISLAGLLETKGPSGRPSFSPARLQMLIATVVVAAQYVHAVIADPMRDSLPALPPAVLAVLGGSHAVYLGGKAIDAFLHPLLKNLTLLKNPK
jgi:hypothetical protein